MPEAMPEAQQTLDDAAAADAAAAAPAAADAAPQRGHAGNEQVDRLGTGKISSILFEFAVPAIVGVVINGLYNVIDAIFLGHAVGELGLAATTVAAPIMIIFLAISMLVGAGGNALAAIRLGEGKLLEAEKILGNSVTLLIIFGALVAFIGTFCLDPLLQISGVTADSLEYSRTFVRIICWGFVFQGIGLGINNFIRTAGAPKRAMVTMIIGAVSCIAFNFLFVMVMGWGVAGSAFATICGQFCASIFVMGFFLSDKTPFRFYTKNMRLDLRVAKEIMALGLASFLLQAAAAVVNLVLNNLLNTYGAMSSIGADGALAVMGVLSKISMFCFFPIMGVSIAAQPMLGYNYGAGFFRRVRTTLFTAAGWATMLGFAFFLLAELFPRFLISLFGVDESLMNFAVPALRIYVATLSFVGAQVVGSNYFQATGQPLKSIILSLSRQLLFLVPLMYIVPVLIPQLIPGVEPVMGLVYAGPISDCLSFFLTGAFVLFELRKLRRLISQEDVAPDPAPAPNPAPNSAPAQSAPAKPVQ